MRVGGARLSRWQAAIGSALVANGFLLLLGLLFTGVVVTRWGSGPAGQFFTNVALFSTAYLLLVAVDQLVTRFGNGRSTPSEARFLAGLLTGKCLVCLTLLPVGLAFGWLLPSGRLPSSSSEILFVGAMAIAFWVVPIIASLMNRIMLLHGQYSRQLLLDGGQMIASCAWAWYCVELGSGMRLDLLAGGLGAIALAGLASRLLVLRTVRPRLWRRLLSELRRPLSNLHAVVHGPYWHYFWPMSVVSVSGFLKESFPVLAVAFVGPAPMVAEFRVLQQMFRTASSLVPAALEWVRPMFVRDMTADVKAFERRYRTWARAYLVFSALLSTALISIALWLLPHWRLMLTPLVYWCAIILAIDLVFGAAMQIEYQVYLLRDRIGHLGTLSLVRQVLTVVVTLATAPAYGGAGAAAGLAAGTAAAWLGFSAVCAIKRVRPTRDVAESISLSVTLVVGIALMAMVTTTWIQ